VLTTYLWTQVTSSLILFVKATATAAPPMRIVVNVHKMKGITKVLARPGLRERSFFHRLWEDTPV